MNNLSRLSIKLATFFKNNKLCISNAVKALTKTQKINDTVFIRHAHSEFNKACQDYRLNNKINYDWDALCQHNGFQDLVAYNPAFIDCPLTNKGVEQCYLTSHNLNLRDIDVILVSPHERALETCENILKFSNIKYKIPVIVEPLIAGSLWSSCDISKHLDEKTKLFKHFDFSRMFNEPQLWFIQNLRLKDKLKIYNQISKRRLTTYKQKQYLVLEMIRNKEATQDRQILRKRAWQIKKQLKTLKTLKKDKMLLISHYYIIQYVNTKLFNNSDNRPMNQVDLMNCLPYYNNLEEMLNYK